jgi:hypothetical protein
MLRRRTATFPLTIAVVCIMLLAGSGLARAQGGTPMASPTASAVASPVAPPTANTGTITGRVADDATGKPLADVYITVGWRDLMLATTTDADGRYTVSNVPAGKSAPVLGFHDNGYRYHNSQYDDKIDIVLKPGETYRFDFSLIRLNDPAGEPQLSNATISSTQVAPGQHVTFEVTAKGSKGKLSTEVIASNPQLGWMVLMAPVGGDRYRATVTIPSSSAPGDYSFVFFAATNACYLNSVFPKVTLHITGS